MILLRYRNRNFYFYVLGRDIENATFIRINNGILIRKKDSVYRGSQFYLILILLIETGLKE